MNRYRQQVLFVLLLGALVVVAPQLGDRDADALWRGGMNGVALDHHTATKSDELKRAYVEAMKFISEGP